MNLCSGDTNSLRTAPHTPGRCPCTTYSPDSGHTASVVTQTGPTWLSGDLGGTGQHQLEVVVLALGAEHHRRWVCREVSSCADVAEFRGLRDREGARGQLLGGLWQLSEMQG